MNSNDNDQEQGVAPPADLEPGLTSQALTSLFAASSASEQVDVERIYANVSKNLFGVGAGAYIGRYRVERWIGSGAKANVFLGIDEELMRKVALKVLRETTDLDERRRLRREARALAKLRHPNVVTVYEVGEHKRCAFVAMEYIDGQTLADWLEDTEPDWRAILARFLAAGRGLAAAHTQGIVHRDFKPENVLLGEDGSVRVVDFGLAVSASEGPPPGERDASTDSTAPLGATGRGGGTLLYMPLEQLRGEIVDARSDEFAFCVALYEALWGQPPFDASSPSARRKALETDKPTPPSSSPVPRSIWRIIVRGLERDPSRRWPSMNALLTALERVSLERRRRRVAALVGVPLLTGLGLLWSTARDPCAAVSSELAGVWDAPREQRLRQHFGELGVEYAKRTGDLIIARLDGWADEWIAEREVWCRASEDLETPEHSQRQQCLARQRREVGALLDLLEEVDPRGIAHAIDATSPLPDPRACANDLVLLGIDPPPQAIEAEVELQRSRIDHARQLRLLGRRAEGHELIVEVERDSTALGYGPLLAEATAELAQAELAGASRQRGIELLKDALELADVHRLDRLRAELLLDLAGLHVVQLQQPELGATFLRQARSAYKRVGVDERKVIRFEMLETLGLTNNATANFVHHALARLARTEGLLFAQRGDMARARTRYQEAIDRGRKAHSNSVPDYLHALANILEVEQPRESLRLRAEAAIYAANAFGTEHPKAIMQLANYSRAGIRAGLGEKFVRELERAIQLWSQSHDLRHQYRPDVEYVSARRAIEELRLEDAQAHVLNLRNILSQVASPTNPEYGDPEYLQAKIERLRQQPERSITHARRAVGHYMHGGRQFSERLADARVLMIGALNELGKLDAAAVEIEALLAEVEPDTLSAIEARLNLAEIYIRLGRPRQAATELATLAMLEPKLGDLAPSVTFLRGLVSLRLGDPLSALARHELAEAYASLPYEPEAVAQWLEDLQVSKPERAAFVKN